MSNNEEPVRLSVIIVSYMNWDVLSACLESIARFNDIGNELEVIVVEQSPSDDIYQYVAGKYPWVKLVRNVNAGFGAGNNRGVEAADGQYYLFLNPDTVLVEPVFDWAINKFDSQSCLGLFGVALRDGNGNKSRSFNFRRPYGMLRALLWHIFDFLGLYLDKSMYIVGADMFVRAQAFNRAGRFDESIFMYYEEADLCNRLNQCGFRTAFFGNKTIIHLEGKSSTNLNAFSRELDSLELLCHKNKVNYRETLRKMKRDRLVKKLLRWDVQRQNNEIDIIQEKLNYLSKK